MKMLQNNKSFPGTIFSLDDFLLTSAGLATTETSLFIYEKELLNEDYSIGMVMEPVRVMVANRNKIHKFMTEILQWQLT
jgi:hypothetical protein